MQRPILAIVIILLIILGAYYLIGPDGLLKNLSDNATTTPVSTTDGGDTTTVTTTTYVGSGEAVLPPGYSMFRRLGISIAYPSDVQAYEQPIAGTKDVLATFGEDLIINYTNKASEWATENLSNYTYIGVQTFGTKTFTVYNDRGSLVYWITNSNDGYEFRLLSNRIDLSTLNFH